VCSFLVLVNGSYVAAVLGQQSFGHLQQIWTRQDVEKLHRLGCFGLASDTGSTLMQYVSSVTIHGGWSSERWFGRFVTTILSIPWSACYPAPAQSKLCRTLKSEVRSSDPRVGFMWATAQTKLIQNLQAVGLVPEIKQTGALRTSTSTF
jgi:hypothetical protein